MNDDLLRHERDQYAAAIRELILTVRHTAHHWSQTQPETMRRDDVVRALYRFAGMPRSMPEGLRDDLWQRIVGAYYLRFEHDGHPEDSKAAADEAMGIVQPELDRLEAEVRELRSTLGQLGLAGDYTEGTEYQIVGDWGVSSAESEDEARRKARETLAVWPRSGARAEYRISRTWDDGSEFHGPWQPLPDAPNQ